MRAFALPVGRREAIDLVALGRAMTRRGLKTLPLHIQGYGRSLPSEQVGNDKPGGLAASGGGHDQSMGEDLRADIACPRLRTTHLTQDEPGARGTKKAPRLHLAARLPMGLTKACERGARHRQAQHKPRDTAAANDQVD